MEIMGEVFELLRGYKDAEGTVHKEFEIREMDGSDEEAISKKEIKSNGAKVLRTLLERCCLRIGTINKSDVKPTVWREIIQSLSTSDQDFMLLKIREVSIGDEFETSYVCPDPDCKENIVVNLPIDEIEITPFDGVWEIPFELPKGFRDKDGRVLKKGKLRQPTGLDREILDGVIRQNTGRANTLMLSRCIIELEGIQVYDELVRDLSVKDRNYLLKVLEEHKYGINLETEVECPTCYNTFKASLNIVNFI